MDGSSVRIVGPETTAVLLAEVALAATTREGAHGMTAGGREGRERESLVVVRGEVQAARKEGLF